MNPVSGNVGDVRLEFRDVTKKFWDRQGSGKTITAVEGVTLSVRDGEVVSLIGPSGCGKSTLLNMASGLNGSSGGEVFVDGEEVVEVNEHVAFMLQKDLLLAWRSIRENVELGLEIQCIDKAERRRRSDDWLARCKIAGGNTGVGYPIVLTAGAAETAKVFAAIFVLTMIGIIAYWLVILLENRVLHYMPSREHRGF
jgi:NitT/TauT family transport system ATP-binding protein